MNVVVFSGTTEGRSFSRALAALGAAVTVCVATELGAEEQGRADGETGIGGIGVFARGNGHAQEFFSVHRAISFQKLFPAPR